MSHIWIRGDHSEAAEHLRSLDYDYARVGKVIQGNRRFKKNLGILLQHMKFRIMQRFPIGHPLDFIRKVEKAKNIRGFRFLHMFTPCIPGWKMDPAKTGEVTKGLLKVVCGRFTKLRMAEKDHSQARKMKSVKDYLMMQGRIQAHERRDIKKLQMWVCKKWTPFIRRKGQPDVCRFYQPEEHHAVTEEHREIARTMSTQNQTEALHTEHMRSLQRIERFLAENGIEYDYVDVDKLHGRKNRIYTFEMTKITGDMRFPTIVIDKKVICWFLWR